MIHPDPVCAEPKVFVGGLRFEVTRDDVFNHFQQYGPIKSCVLLTHKDTGKSKGCAMVLFHKWAHAEAAMEQDNGAPSDLTAPRPLMVKCADPQRRPEDGMLIGVTPKKLFVGQLPKGVTADQIRGLCASYGEIVDLNTMPPKRDNAMGCAFVTFSTWAAAEAAMEALNGVFTFPGAGQPIAVKFADAKPQDMQRVGAKRGINMEMMGGGGGGSGGPSKRQLMMGGFMGKQGGMGGMGNFGGMGMGMNPMMMGMGGMGGMGMGMPGMGMMGQGMGMMNPGMMGMMGPMGQGMGMAGGMGAASGQAGGSGSQGWQQGGQTGGTGSNVSGQAGGNMPGQAGGGMGDQAGQQGPAGMAGGQEGGQAGGMAAGMGGFSQGMNMGAMGNMGNMGAGGMANMGYGGMGGMGNMGAMGGMGGMGMNTMGMGMGMGMPGMGMGMGMGGAKGGQALGIGNANGNLQAAKAWKLFIGQISFDCNEADLFPFFAQFGTVLELVLLRNPGDARHRGCGFVIYNSSDEADNAIQNANGTILPNDHRHCSIVVKYANQKAQQMAS